MNNSITWEVLARSHDPTELIGDMNVALPKSLLLMFSKAHVSLHPDRSRRHQCSKTLSSCWMFVFTAHFFSSLLLWFTMQTVCGTFLQPIEEAQKKSRVYSETEMAVCLRSTDCSSADWLGPSLSGYPHCDQNRFAYNLWIEKCASFRVH